MNLKRFLAIAVLSLMSFQGYATHLLGGEIVWKCKPNGKYQFTLVLYRECGGISLPTSAQSLATMRSEVFPVRSSARPMLFPRAIRELHLCWGNVGNG